MQQWFHDAVVLEVSAAGVKVRFNNDSSEKFVLRSQVGTLLKSLDQPSSVTQSLDELFFPKLLVPCPDAFAPVREVAPVFSKPAQVTLHVYDLSNRRAIRGVNKVLRGLGAGIYHVGIEVHGFELSFSAGFELQDGDNPADMEPSGIFLCEPRTCDGHRYRESVVLGMTEMVLSDVATLLERLRHEWLAEEYDFTRRNCVSFCRALSEELGVGVLPPWVGKLAKGAAAFINLKDAGMRRVRAFGNVKAVRSGGLRINSAGAPM